MQIYVLRDEQQTGPFTVGEICSQLATGEITRATFVWWEGLPEWQTLEQSQLVPPATAVIGKTPELVDGRTTASLAIWSLVLGILGFLSTPILPIIAVLTGHFARAKINRRHDLKGEGLALTGLILGYFWIAVAVLMLIFHQKVEKMEKDVQDTYMQLQGNQPKQDSTDPNAAPATPPNQ